MPQIRFDSDVFEFVTDISGVSIQPAMDVEDFEVNMTFQLPPFYKKYPRNSSTIKFWDVGRRKWSQRGCIVNVSDDYLISGWLSTAVAIFVHPLLLYKS